MKNRISNVIQPLALASVAFGACVPGPKADSSYCFSGPEECGVDAPDPNNVLNPPPGSNNDNNNPGLLQDAFNYGAFLITPDGTALAYVLSGGAGMVRSVSGQTSVLVEVEGLNPDIEYPAHVHNQPCNTGGGGHYEIDDTITEVIEANEIWPTITVDANGRGRGAVTVDHIARPEATSVVIHEPGDGSRIACADLLPGEQIATGSFVELADGVGLGLAGTASLRRYAAGTEVLVELTGVFDPAKTYPAHVHDAPCATGGGGHYKIDYAIDEAIETNEIWPVLQIAADGLSATGQVATAHVARPEAMSIVVHDPDNGNRLICADLSWLPPDGPVVGSPDQFNYGLFALTPDGAELAYPLSGSAGMVRSGDGTTSVLVEVLGLNPDTEYPAHVHDAPCNTGGGAHYKIDPTVQEVLVENEIWPVVSVGPDGVGRGSVTVPHLARPEAQSVVIHEPGVGTRIGCADLLPNGEATANGSFLELPDGQGLNLSGTVSMVRGPNGTSVSLNLSGTFTSTESYPAHVHNLPCGENAGGAHYKIDPDVVEVVEENEIWPILTVGNEGTATGEISVPHIARPEAQSVVVHDPANGNRLVCADLSWLPDENPGVSRDQFNSGALVLLPDGLAFGYTITGTAGMVRSNDGQTSVMVQVEGLDADTVYPAHVHDAPCATGGGAHYKIDDTVAEVVEENEIWPTVTVDAEGLGRGAITVDHRARQEAQSVVIHEPGTAERLACADLLPDGDVEVRGAFITLPDGDGLDLQGEASMRRVSRRGTLVRVTLAGSLAPDTVYPAHVHNLPCDQEAGGAHYKIDPDVVEVIESNEIWPRVETDNNGDGEGAVFVPHIARPEAQSVVVHDPATGNRLVCADLR